MTLLCRPHTNYQALLLYWIWALQIIQVPHGHNLCFFWVVCIGISTGYGTLIYMQLKCRREGPHNHAVPTQARNFWPYGGPWGSTDQFCSNSPELLRLHRIAPLPSALPNLAAPLMPQLQLGFTAAQALQRVAVSAFITTYANL